MATPYDMIVLDEVTSTQDLAMSRLEDGDGPVLVVAGRQTAGRGRSGNDWWQAPRGVAASLGFTRDLFVVDDTFSLAVGLAVRAALAAVTDVVVGLKWPNDLELAGRKVGGVLVELDPHRVVVGCGINLWWPDAPEGAGGMLSSLPDPTVGTAVSEAWARSVLLSQGGWDRPAYLEACSILGAAVTWDPDGYGTVETVDERGGLVVVTKQGTTTLRSGEVRRIRPVE